MPDPGRKRTISYFIPIVLLNFIVYFPSLFHVPRSDQLIYWVNTAGQKEWLALAINHYAYNRMDLPFGIQDHLLFRPLFYFLIGTEKYFFGYHFAYWQLAGIVLHLLVVWSLLTLLMQIHHSIFAGLLTAFFSVLFVNNEMIVWHHINGYLVFILCILVCLKELQLFIVQKHVSLSAFIKVLCVLTAAAFIYEIGVIYGLLFAVFFYFSFDAPIKDNQHTLCGRRCLPLRGKAATAFAFCLPSLLYLTVNFLDFHLRGLHFSAQDQFVLQGEKVIRSSANAFVVLFWWAFGGLFPKLLFTELGQRAFVYPPLIDYRGRTLDLSLPTILTALAGLWMVITYATILKKSFSKHLYKQKRSILILLGCMIFAQGFMLCLGRISIRGLERILLENTYNYYFFWIFSVVFIYYSIPFGHFEKAQRRTALKRISMTLLTAFIVLNGGLTFRLNRSWADVFKLHRDLNQDIKILSEKHSPKGDFSFGVHSDFNPELYLPWVEGPEGKGYNYLQLLYPQYYSQSNPRYLLIRGGEHGWKWQERP